MATIGTRPTHGHRNAPPGYGGGSGKGNGKGGNYREECTGTA